MNMRTFLGAFLAIAAVPGFLGNAKGQVSLTDPKVPSPTALAAQRWAMAGMLAPWVELWGDRFQGMEAARMLNTIQRGDGLRAGLAWYDPGQRRHDWAWFAKQFDVDGNGLIGKKEWQAAPEFFAALDRDRDGAITAADFDWSDKSPWVRQTGISLRLFRMIDKNGNGKINEAEMSEYFKKLAGEKEFVDPDNLRDALLLAMAQESPKGKSRAKKVADEVWMKSLFEGDLGSPFDGPALGQLAPNFTLATQDGKTHVTLSQFRTHLPVVLIFGSFT